ncbi:MAG TPA: hypothetical protein DEP35_10980 [Deltaproteobacteria bacterium]|nr:hypothetical protein [Deltaproteobacteria bacterium]
MRPQHRVSARIYSVSLRCAASLALALLVSLGCSDEARPKAGAYCKISEEGQASACLAPAQHAYPAFFRGLAQDKLSDEQAREVETDIAQGAQSERSYEALSTLAYGYYRLARAASSQGTADPETLARLEHWNELLSKAYASSEKDPRYREALRQAAVDVGSRTPPLGLRCTDADGKPARCDSTEAVVRAMDEARDQTGVRGEIGRLFDRVFGTRP